MSTSELMKAMADAGAPFEAILIAVQALDAKDAEIARREREAADKRAKDAERKRLERANGSRKKRPRTVHGRSKDCPLDPPIDNTHTPDPDISPVGESQSQRDDVPAVIESWNAMAKPLGLPACQKLTGQRLKACKARLRDDGLQAIQDAIQRIPKSAFLRGETGSWGGANITFLLRPDTVTKILEGQYDDRQQQRNCQTFQRSNVVGIDRRSTLARVIDDADARLDFLS